MLPTAEQIRAVMESDRERVEASLSRALASRPGCPDRLADALRYAVLGPGKRLRPLLVLGAYRACGGSGDEALPCAVAVELIHAYSLVHDDLPAMDDDDLRRGRPTCHIRYDEATAILVGDALIPLAFELLSTGVSPADRAVACVRELAEAAGASRLVGGQADDLAAERGEGAATLEFLEAVHLRKTAALLIASLRLGGIVADAGEETLQALGTYGRHLGLGFQITDDLLDFLGDPAKMGKRASKDLQRGKVTYPALMGEAACRELVRENIDAAIRAIDGLGEPAAGLVWIARSIIDRTH